MLNKVQLVGHLGTVPESKGNDPENPITTFSVATSETYVAKSGEKKTDTTWFSVTAYGRFAKYSTYLQKGSLVFVEGTLKENKWTDSQGVERKNYVLRVSDLKNLSPKSTTENTQQSNHNTEQNRSQVSQVNNYQPPVQQSKAAPQANTQRVQNPAYQQPTHQVQQPRVETYVQQQPQFTEQDFDFATETGDELPF